MRQFAILRQMNVMEEKAALRRHMKGLLAAYRQDRRSCLMEERTVARLLLQSDIYAEAATILAYAATDREFSLDGLIVRALRDGKAVALPRCNPADRSMSFHRLSPDVPYRRQVSAGAFGIREPVPSLPPLAGPMETALILMPGLAFTREGHRLGKGGGFYDRFLAPWRHRGQDAGTMRRGPALMGVCHSFQLVDSLPTEDTDVMVDHLLIPTGIISRAGGRPAAT